MPGPVAPSAGKARAPPGGEHPTSAQPPRRLPRRQPHKAKHRQGGPLLAFERPDVAVGRIRDDGPTAIGHSLARQEVYPRRAKAVIGDIRRRDVVAAPLHHGRDCAGAATRFPDSPPELNMPKKRLSDPVRSCVEVADFAIVAGDVDRAGDAGPQRPGACDRLRPGCFALGEEITHASRTRSASSASSPDASGSRIRQPQKDFVDAPGHGLGRAL